MRKIIILTFSPVSKLTSRMLMLETIIKKYVIWDLSKIFYKDRFINKYLKSYSNYRNRKKTIYIKNLADLKKKISKIKSKTILWYLGRGLFPIFDDEKYFLSLLKNKNIKIIISEFNINYFRSGIYKIKELCLLVKYFFLNLKIDKKITIFCSGSKAKFLFSKLYRKKEIYKINSPLVLLKKKRKKNFAVYIEENWFNSPDRKLFHYNSGDKKKYKDFYNKLNIFFSKFENYFCMDIKIGASEKIYYTKNEFRNRKIIYGDTLNLINNSSYVLGHSSLALYQAVVSNVPIFLLNDSKIASTTKQKEIFEYKEKLKTFYFDLNEYPIFNKYKSYKPVFSHYKKIKEKYIVGSSKNYNNVLEKVILKNENN